MNKHTVTAPSPAKARSDARKRVEAERDAAVAKVAEFKAKVAELEAERAALRDSFNAQSAMLAHLRKAVAEAGATVASLAASVEA